VFSGSFQHGVAVTERPDLGPGRSHSERRTVAKPLCEKFGIARFGLIIKANLMAVGGLAAAMLVAMKLRGSAYRSRDMRVPNQPLCNRHPFGSPRPPFAYQIHPSPSSCVR